MRTYLSDFFKKAHFPFLSRCFDIMLQFKYVSTFSSLSQTKKTRLESWHIVFPIFLIVWLKIDFLLLYKKRQKFHLFSQWLSALVLIFLSCVSIESIFYFYKKEVQSINHRRQNNKAFQKTQQTKEKEKTAFQDVHNIADVALKGTSIARECSCIKCINT